MKVATLIFTLLVLAGFDWKKQPQSYWKEKLSPKQFEVCRNKGTERAFSGEYDKFYKPGTYECSSCGLPLFSSKAKFDSKTGWPSYWEPISKEAVILKPDNTFFLKRTEVVCSRCNAHLGHVFDDGPKPTGKRYCINSVCLKFKKSE